MNTPDDPFTLGLRSHRAGDLDNAERCYRTALDRNPNHADAWHMLGVVACHRGAHDLALEHIGRALQLRPSDAAFLLNQGVALQGLGQTARAADAFRQALAARPDFPEAHNNLANVLRALGQPAEAREHWQRALALRPDYAEAHRNLAVVLREQGEPSQALHHAREAARLQPRSARSLVTLGDCLTVLGRPAEAADAFQGALRLRPADADLHCRLAHVLRLAGRLQEALAAVKESLRLRPVHADAHNTAAAVLGTLGRAGEAEAHARQALALRPDDAEASHNLAVLLVGRRCLPEAIELFRRALRLRPELIEPAIWLARALSRQGLLDEAEDVLRQALTRHPRNGAVHAALGEVLSGQGLLDEAQTAFRTALAHEPNLETAHSSLLITLSFDPRPTPAELLAEHRRFDAHYARVALCQPDAAHNRDPHRPLRVGYVSPDLLGHVVVKFFAPVLMHHDRRHVEAICYADVPAPDAVTERLHQLAAGWRVIRGLSDEAVARQVQADGIDVLVDLAGHTGKRLGVFARRPAPVQVTWLGYPETTGLGAMRYRLTDAVVAPPGMEAHHTEEMVRLPGCFCCYLPSVDSPAVAEAPCRTRGGVTFGSLHKLAKLNDGVLQVWSEVLRAVPGSRLLVYRDVLRGRVAAALGARLTRLGVDESRVELRCVPPEGGSHLAMYGEVDVLLDVWPWSGHATACEALWQGVPVLTLRGERHASRMVASVLECVGMKDWIADTAEGFVARAVELASDPARLVALRHGLRETVRRSPLCDGATFTRRLEDIYRELWQRWVREERSVGLQA